MRWDDLFADLEAQADALDVAERASEIGDRTRIEVGALSIIDRLRAGVGTQLQVRCGAELMITGTLCRVGPDWVLLDEGGGREAVLALAAVRSVHGLGRVAAAPGSGGVVAAKLGLRAALRGLARDRSAVRIHLREGAVMDATIDRVGADFVEVAQHAPGEARRRGDVREVSLVRLAAIAAVRRGSG